MLKSKALVNFIVVALCTIFVIYTVKLLNSIFSPEPRFMVQNSSALYRPFLELQRTSLVSSQLVVIQRLITNQVQVVMNAP